MNKFFCIYKKPDISVDLLKKSARDNGLEFIHLNPDTFGNSSKINFKKGDLLYRPGIGRDCRNLEISLIDKNVTTFYRTYERATTKISNLRAYQENNIPVPKTILKLSKDRELLKKQVEEVGGFPVIIKAVGGSHGVGVMKIDSFSSLFSILDFLLTKNKDIAFVMKQFIDVTSSARLIVLGDEVIDSIEYVAPEGDFRSNEGEIPNVRIKKFSPEVEQTAVAATKALGLEFAGTDILIDDKGNHFLAENNFPCFFPRAQKLTGKNISDLMIKYLIKKANTNK